MSVMSLLTIPAGRECSLSGPEAGCAVERGLMTATWYKTHVSRASASTN